MYKKDAKYHYGIKKHICGTAYENDFFVVNENMKYVMNVPVTVMIIGGIMNYKILYQIVKIVG